MNKTHDPKSYAGQLQQLLISDKKKIAFLFGAGTSAPRISTTEKMTAEIEKKIIKNPKYRHALSVIKEKLASNYNIETLLSDLEIQHQAVWGKDTLNGLKKEEIESLIEAIKSQIKKKVSVHNKIGNEKSIHAQFAEWITKANRKHAIEIFTTNYDYLFEIGLEAINIPFYDGFTGSYKPFFNAASIEDMGFIPAQTKLWKIHGSLGWHYDGVNKKITREPSDKNMLIYPSALKYSESKKMPYMALIDRLTNFLKQPDTVLITCGYSFRDEHINERITTALSGNDSGHVYALLYDKRNIKGKDPEYSFKEDSNLAKMAKSNTKLSFYGCRHAVIGGQFGKWKLNKEPDKDDTINTNLYFYEDAHTDEEDPISDQLTNTSDSENDIEQIWAGAGEFILPEFKKFVEFLQKMIITDQLSEESS